MERVKALSTAAWQGRGVGWEEELFGYLDDLEGQAAGLYDAQRAPELEDRGRAEYQQVTLASRLVASLDRELTLDLHGVGAVTGQLVRVGTGWCLMRGPGQDWVVRLDAVGAVQGQERAWSLSSSEIGLTLPALLAELERSGDRLRALNTRSATLEDVFVALTGRALRDA